MNTHPVFGCFGISVAFAGALLTVLDSTALLAQSPGIEIISPADGTTVAPGDTISVSIRGSAGTTILKASAWVIPPSTIPTVVDVSPFVIPVIVPTDVAGEVSLMAAAVDTGQRSLRTSIKLNVQPTGSVQSLSAMPSRILFLQAGDQMPIRVSAKFNDGMSRDVAALRSTRYTSSNMKAATVSGTGMVQAVAAGSAVITITLDQLSTTIAVDVGKFEMRGDLDGDGDVTQADVNILLKAVNTPATGPDDPRDLNGDGVINALDSRILVTLCTRLGCAGH